MNNYNRIKSMTVDEMKMFLINKFPLSCNDYCCNPWRKCEDCEEEVKQWLLSEVTDD